MPGDQPHRFPEQADSRRNAMPGGGAGRVGQWNQVEGAAVVAELKRSTHDFVELLEGKKLGDREFADGNDELWSQKIDFIIHPGRTIPDFVRRRDAVAARGGFAGEAATDCGKINLGTDLFLAQRAELLEPPEKRATRGPRKWFAQDGLFYPRRLTDQDHFAQDGTARHRRRYHPGTTPALPQKRNMSIEVLLFARGPRHKS